MKLYKLYIGLGLLAMGGGITSCSSDYLDQPPITSIDNTQIGESIEAARAALYGLCQAMYCGFYGDNSDRNNSGEAWFQTYYGDAGSPDFWDSFIWGYQSEFQNWSLMRRNTYWGSRNAWMYGYNLIGQANSILDVIDNVPASADEVNFVKAQALTIRAHGYIRLMQVYGPRYEDSKNGQELCVILKDKPGLDPLPLSNYADCMAFIYKDLNTAIDLFKGSSVQRTFGYEPNLNVAQGLFSRIALLNHDWQLAADMAKEARQGFPIMTPDAYRTGFIEPTSEWLWYNDPDNTYVGYRSWGASYACNGAYAIAYNWSGAGCISFRLYDQIYERSKDDVRCEFFWTPDKANKYAALGILRKDFWDPKYVNEEYEFMYGPSTSTDAATKTANEKMSAAIALFSKNMNPDPTVFTESAFGTDLSITEKTASSAVSRKIWFNSLPATTVNTCQPGAQLKFWSYPESQYNASSHPFLRSSELLLTQAEAELELGHDATALQLLIELNSQRIPDYTCNLTGDALREEIRLYRRMELWGEGDCWFSFKRWNTTISRNKWEANDPTSDTFLPAYEGTYEPSYANGWRYLIPTAETNYNPLVADQLNQ